MKPDPKKVQALQDLPIPQTQKELQSFLGLINYLQPFLPDLSHKTTFLRRTSQQLGLDTIYRCSISPPQTMDMQYTTKDNISLL